jgi:hypothetical protein
MLCRRIGNDQVEVLANPSCPSTGSKVDGNCDGMRAKRPYSPDTTGSLDEPAIVIQNIIHEESDQYLDP